VIDLRSDTVTQPTAAMREAMARARVGDDMYGEDPTARELEETVAELLGKEAALFVPSGTMGNQLALMTSTRRGDEVVCGEYAHLCWTESGAAAALSGVQFATAGRGGLFTRDDLSRAIKPELYVYPRTSVVAIENTHNQAGGRVFPQADIVDICTAAHARGLRCHLDGARLWNAAIATGKTPADLARPFDTVSVCFSKGLGAPIGSALLGRKDQLAEAHRLRRMLGAGMRQVGIIAEGARYALEHHRARIADDHEHAHLFARRVTEHIEKAGLAGVRVQEPETNIVNISVPNSATVHVKARAVERGVHIGAMAEGVLRAVFHLDVRREDTQRAADVLGEVLRDVCA
jgi:threonine aldolase